MVPPTVPLDGLPLKSRYRSAVLVSFFLFALICVLAASREYALAGAVPVFTLLILAGFGLAALSGYPLVSSSAMSAFLLAYDQLDKFKFDLLRTHIQLPDSYIIMGFLADLDFSILLIYIETVVTVISSFVLVAILLYLLYRYERKQKKTPSGFSRNVPAALLIFLAAGACIYILLSSTYVSAVMAQHINRLMSDHKPIRPSVAMVGYAEYAKLSWRLRQDPRFSDAALASDRTESCDDCPDLVIVHLESVFDPVMLTPYSDQPPFSQIMSQSMFGRYGFMKANIWGGFSWVTEFEIVCGLNHKLFGWAGLYTHYNIAPFLKGCSPHELKNMGYSTEALYTVPKSFINIGPAFANYGVDTFYDARALGLPSNAKNIEDAMMVDLLLEKLRQPGSQPKFIFLSTNWNHGPHGARFAKQAYEGPYDPSRAADDQLADYINRLNHTIAAFGKLKQYMQSTNRRIAVMFYGDHHPYFQKEYDETFVRAIGANPDFLTALSFMRNYSVDDTAAEVKPMADIPSSENTFGMFLEFAGVPALNGLAHINKIASQCGGSQLDCDDKKQGILRSVFLK